MGGVWEGTKFKKKTVFWGYIKQKKGGVWVGVGQNEKSAVFGGNIKQRNGSVSGAPGRPLPPTPKNVLNEKVYAINQRLYLC